MRHYPQVRLSRLLLTVAAAPCSPSPACFHRVQASRIARTTMDPNDRLHCLYVVSSTVLI